MNKHDEFKQEVLRNVAGLGADTALQALSHTWIRETSPYHYTYNFRWLDRPIIQFPQDIVAIQELIWKVKPDLIIETGIAHGGSLILSASMLSLLDYCDAVKAKTTFDPLKTSRRVLGIDIDIRPHNRIAVNEHPLSHRIDMIQGSSIAPEIIERVQERAAGYTQVLVILDSNHTHEHVMAELEAYAPLTSKNSYCVVFDTIIEDMPDDMFSDRPWGKGNNPKTAVWEYLRRLKEDGRRAADAAALNFEIDKSIESKLLITVAPDGYLRRVE